MNTSPQEKSNSSLLSAIKKVGFAELLKNSDWRRRLLCEQITQGDIFKNAEILQAFLASLPDLTYQLCRDASTCARFFEWVQWLQNPQGILPYEKILEALFTLFPASAGEFADTSAAHWLCRHPATRAAFSQWLNRQSPAVLLREDLLSALFTVLPAAELANMNVAAWLYLDRSTCDSFLDVLVKIPKLFQREHSRKFLCMDFHSQSGVSGSVLSALCSRGISFTKVLNELLENPLLLQDKDILTALCVSRTFMGLQHSALSSLMVQTCFAADEETKTKIAELVIRVLLVVEETIQVEKMLQTLSDVHSIIHTKLQPHLENLLKTGKFDRALRDNWSRVSQLIEKVDPAIPVEKVSWLLSPLRDRFSQFYFHYKFAQALPQEQKAGVVNLLLCNSSKMDIPNFPPEVWENCVLPFLKLGKIPTAAPDKSAPAQPEQ